MRTVRALVVMCTLDADMPLMIFITNDIAYLLIITTLRRASSFAADRSATTDEVCD